MVRVSKVIVLRCKSYISLILNALHQREESRRKTLLLGKAPENAFLTESFSEITDTCHTKPVEVNEVPLGFNVLIL